MSDSSCDVNLNLTNHMRHEISEYGQVHCLVSPLDYSIQDARQKLSTRFKRQNKEVEARPTCAPGVQLYEDYVAQRIIGDVSLWAPVKKQKNMMYMSSSKKQAVKILDQTVDLKETRSLYGRLMVLTRSNRDIDQKNAVVNYEFTLTPRALFSPDGSITTKDLAKSFNKKLTHLTSGFSVVILVFDTYKSDSLKQKTRERRRQGTSPVQYQISDDTQIKHIPLTRFLSHEKTKADLTDYLAKVTLDFQRDSPQLVITSASGHTNSNRNLTFEEKNHEEADTLMICLAVEASHRYPDAQLIFFTPDTDVLVLVVSKQNKIKQNKMVPRSVKGHRLQWYRAIPRTRVKTGERLKRLRKLMKKENIDAYIIPRSDEHNSEYTANFDRRRSWITGFDGSYGDAVVLMKAAALWTDGRYFLQAEEQLDCNWDLMKLSFPGVPNITTWLLDNLRAGSNVVADPKIIRQSKVNEIAWLFNLRGSDVPYNPVFKSYAFVARNFIKLYVNLEKIDDSVKDHLGSDGCTHKNCVALVEYSKIWMNLKEIFNTMGKVLITSRSSFALYDTVPQEQRMIIESPLIMMKAVKNPVEVEGMRNAHFRDSAVIVDFVSSLEEGIGKGEHWDEMKAVETLAELRSKQQYNKGESFETISAFASNGAVIHYKPTLTTNKKIDNSDMYLLDSGGQYLDGTTDITRTFHFGTPTDFHRETYTRVLMGAIDLAKLIFPHSTTDRNIDNIARKYLHEIGLDYNHGTGHGIGAFLNIHEGPTLVRKPTPKHFGSILLPRMFLSDEPGYYEDKSFGIRLETVVMVENKTTLRNFNHVPYYGFESIALVPFEPKLIKYELLSQQSD
ncbi:putative Xaa-Pro aminopeptidase P [Nymphon striatum]|nr:putative Xaa-Pro aminopeptidase P [Nymphon striatum]